MDSGSHNKRCSVASPEATKKPDFKTWGKSRSLRLPDFDYASPWIVYHVNIRSKDKKRIFRSSSINEKVVEVLKSSVDLYGYHLLSYCLMPDHLHILVQAGESPKNLESFVRGFKSYNSKLAKQHLWQRGFYERILRKEESLADVAQYILDNPVRKRIVEDSEQFKWCELLVEDFGNDSSQKRPSSQE
ncbi:transposase [bacterium]|nr:transposase [bacterium]